MTKYFRHRANSFNSWINMEGRHSSPAFVGNLIILTTFLITVLPSQSWALQCYQCTITPPGSMSNQTKRLCVDFDYSDRYIVDCPYSTMCMKKAFDLVLANNDRVHGVLRDCASQKYDYQILKNRSWHDATEIQEAYKEGCHFQDDKGARSLPTEYCYCRNHLCNSSTSVHKGSELNYHTDAMAVIMVFNAMKYFRSTQ